MLVKSKEIWRGEIVEDLDFDGKQNVELPHHLHSTILYFFVIWDDQYRNPNINDKDHLVGQLTSSRDASARRDGGGRAGPFSWQSVAAGEPFALALQGSKFFKLLMHKFAVNCKSTLLKIYTCHV